jgi:hypothetical protein
MKGRSVIAARKLNAKIAELASEFRTDGNDTTRALYDGIAICSVLNQALLKRR